MLTLWVKIILIFIINFQNENKLIQDCFKFKINNKFLIKLLILKILSLFINIVLKVAEKLNIQYLKNH